ncbi:hypothetical protein PUN28_009610 [Cardiocondyla obscurior]|uniref:Uncharacterized protein n=1 Tax=Cardiocondyla obscurior TaxID=286306 RepID=A0AAW2FYZ2_9HYME
MAFLPAAEFFLTPLSLVAASERRIDKDREKKLDVLSPPIYLINNPQLKKDPGRHPGRSERRRRLRRSILLQRSNPEDYLS